MGETIDFKNFTQQLERGLFCLYILWKANEQAISGIDLSELEHDHDHRVSAGSLYPKLHDLTEKGYLVMDEVNEHGKIHKYYKTTEEGRELLKKVREELGEPMKDFLTGWIGKPFYNIEIGEKEERRFRESEKSIIQIVKDDILHICGEDKGKKVSLKSIETKIKASDSFISRVIRQLEEEGLIKLQEGFITLTKNGKNKVDYIIKKYSILEDYFKEIRNNKNLYKEIDFLEHYISEEALNNIKKLSTFDGTSVPLGKFGLNREGLITDIEFSVGGLFERMVSMGIFPGEKIKIMHETPDGFVVYVNNKKIAIGKDIAKGVKVVKHA
jgi:DNA-binding PadR family transcriptional regulator/Fe2+ transport system protein FeoA